MATRQDIGADGTLEASRWFEPVSQVAMVLLQSGLRSFEQRRSTDELHPETVEILVDHAANDPDTRDSWLQSVIDATPEHARFVEALSQVISIVPAPPGIYASPECTLSVTPEGRYRLVIPSNPWGSTLEPNTPTLG